MGQSLTKNYIHIVFSTKNRFPLINPSFEGDLHAYLGGICKNLDCPVIAIGGHVDHVHILCLLSKKIALMKIMQKVKAGSSKWIKTKYPALQNFYWQNGYGAFSVNHKEVETEANYINNQHEHHKKKTFQEEYRSFLSKNNIEFDERYIWD